MSDILKDICASTLARVEAEERSVPLAEVKRQALSSKGGTYAFASALKGDNLAVIAEVKKASPSKGVIDDKFDYLSIARDYEQGGASAVSCLTEPHYFLGSDDIFRNIRNQIKLPMLRKDFILTPYQVYTSALIGADCILLIMSVLGRDRAEELFSLAQTLGMDALFECRNGEQTEAAQRMGGRIIGVNNRNLSDFSVDCNRAAKYRSLVDKSNIFVSESGMMSAADAAAQRRAGADAVLVGEYFMKSADRVAAVRELRCVR